MSEKCRFCSKRIFGAGAWDIEVVQRPPGVKGFQLLPRRWVVERTFAWFGRCRRLAKDFEAAAATAVAWLLVAPTRLLPRRLAAAHRAGPHYESVSEEPQSGVSKDGHEPHGSRRRCAPPHHEEL